MAQLTQTDVMWVDVFTAMLQGTRANACVLPVQQFQLATCCPRDAPVEVIFRLLRFIFERFFFGSWVVHDAGQAKASLSVSCFFSV